MCLILICTVTERARKLRAQYALQAQSLRTRVESRVNRIPKNLRTAKMGELLLKYAESIQRDEEASVKATIKPVPTKPIEKSIANADLQAVKSELPSPTRGAKRSRFVFTVAMILRILIEPVTPWRQPIKRTPSISTSPSPIQRSVTKQQRQCRLVKSRTLLRCSLPNLPIRGLYLILLYAHHLAHFKSHIFRSPFRP